MTAAAVDAKLHIDTRYVRALLFEDRLELSQIDIAFEGIAGIEVVGALIHNIDGTAAVRIDVVAGRRKKHVAGNDASLLHVDSGPDTFGRTALGDGNNERKT